MKLRILYMKSVVSSALLSVLSLGVGAQEYGAIEYKKNCSICHGVHGKGNGPFSEYLIRPPADLTVLAKRNFGVFPVSQVWQTIDGRDDGGFWPHGSREMPVWGYVYRSEGGQSGDLIVRSRLASLVDYLSGLQEQ